jgi:hypothetical protein
MAMSFCDGNFAPIREWSSWQPAIAYKPFPINVMQQKYQKVPILSFQLISG